MLVLLPAEVFYHAALLQERVPFAVVGSNTVLEVNGRRMRGRQYPWGIAEGKFVDICMLYWANGH